MAKKSRSAPGGEVLEKAAETAKAEQYWILADKSEPHVPAKGYKYVEELTHLQIELIKMQEWVKHERLKVCVIFEGRDAAGKGGVIKRITDPLNPRICRVVALSTPTEKERGQWYFQRYVAELPSAGEIVLFDRSWYNRAGVERVMGFCTDQEYREFLRACPLFEEMLIKSGIILAKYWFSVNDEEQEVRFQERMRNPVKRWKLSGMDVESRRHWVDYSRAKDAMFAETDTKISPWYVVNSDDKRKSRLNCIAHLLSKILHQATLSRVELELPALVSSDELQASEKVEETKALRALSVLSHTTSQGRAGMRWGRWYAAKSYVMSTLWLSPLIAFMLAQMTYRVPYVLGIEFGAIPGFIYSEQGRISALDTNITMNLTFVVFTFGSMLVAIQIASAQLSPRIIATVLLRDNVIRVIVGLFTYGLVVALGARNRTETIPNFVISIAALWGLVSVVAFLFLIDYAARLLRPLSIVRRMAEQGLKVLADVFPEAAGPHADLLSLRAEAVPAVRTIAHAGKSGVILAVNIRVLVAAAARFGVVVELVPQVGDFVATGRPLLVVRGGRGVIDDRHLAGQVAFGAERTIEQDSMFAFRVIVDIAIKALSPAINDPTTAVTALDQLQRLLHDVGRRYLRGEAILDPTGQPRLILRTPNWEDFVQLSCSEIRYYGASNFQIARKLQAMLLDLIHVLPQYRAPALQRQIDLLNSTLDGGFLLPADRELAGTADSQGLGGRIYHE